MILVFFHWGNRERVIELFWVREVVTRDRLKQLPAASQGGEVEVILGTAALSEFPNFTLIPVSGGSQLAPAFASHLCMGSCTVNTVVEVASVRYVTIFKRY